MNSFPSQCKEDIRARAIALGASACGFARAEEIDVEARETYRRWIDDGGHATMQYCEKYSEQRCDPRTLLDGAKTVISCAFNYYNADCALPLAPYISRYAWGRDYHWVVKARLTQLGQYLVESYGGTYRVCVDSAPIRERYWAEKSGIGFIGRNSQLIIPGQGSYFFLGEVIWTQEVEPDLPCTLSCDDCGACIRACPGKALDGTGRCDARRCISYLTIEHRGDLPEGIRLRGSIYGCDICQSVCKHNASPSSTSIDEFKPYEPLLSLTVDDLAGMTSSHFRRLTAQSAMSRVTLKQLLRNIEASDLSAETQQ